MHPPEINRIKSKRQVKELCELDGLSMVDYYFGPQDLFTQAVVVLEKGVNTILSQDYENTNEQSSMKGH